MTVPMISVVMPAFNEAEILDRSVTTVADGLRDRGAPFEIIVVENGSTDATGAIADGLGGRIPEVRVVHLDTADYGRALRAGLLAADGDVVVNFDVDFFDLEFLDAAVVRLREPGGPAIVVGSKRAPGAEDTRSLLRRVATWCFATLLRIGFGLSVSDTHGVKALRTGDVRDAAQACLSGTDLFDTELVLRVERLGLRVTELPVTVRELRPARSPFLARVPRTLLGLCRLRFALGRERRRAR
ncbi:MAG: glycosyltransferase [Actinomycetota bacterium]